MGGRVGRTGAVVAVGGTGVLVGTPGGRVAVGTPGGSVAVGAPGGRVGNLKRVGVGVYPSILVGPFFAPKLAIPREKTRIIRKKTALKYPSIFIKISNII